MDCSLDSEHNLRVSSMKFNPIWFRGCVEMAADRRTDGRMDGQTDRWTDRAATICSPFWERKNNITLGDSYQK